MPTNNRKYQREYMRKFRAKPGYKHWRIVKKEKEEAREKLKKRRKKLKKTNKKKAKN
mgnify:CR=1 FL=1